MSYPFSEKHTDSVFKAKDGTQVNFIRYVAAQFCQSETIKSLPYQGQLKMEADADTLKQIVMFMHGTDIPLTVNNIEPVAIAAQVLKFKKLEKETTKWLKNHISDDTITLFYNLAIKLKNNQIKKKVLDRIINNLTGENALTYFQLAIDIKNKSLLQKIHSWIKTNQRLIFNNTHWTNLDYSTMKQWLTKIDVDNKKAEEIWLSKNVSVNNKPELAQVLFSPEFIKNLTKDEITTWLSKPIVKNKPDVFDAMIQRLTRFIETLSKDEITTWLTNPVINSHPMLLSTLVKRLTAITKAKETEHFDDFYQYTHISLPENVVDLKITKCLHSEWEDAPEYHHDYSYDVEFTYWCLEEDKKIPITVSINYRSWGTYENRYEPYIEKEINIKVDSARVSNLTARWCEMYFNDPADGQKYSDGSFPKDDHPMKLIDKLYNQYVDEFSDLASKIYNGFGEIKA